MKNRKILSDCMITPPEKLLNFLKTEDGFIIATHFSPDGDALGSSLALWYALRKLGKNAALLDKDNIGDQYKFLPGQENFKTFNTLQSPEKYKNLILIDCNDIDRVSLDAAQADILKNKYSAVIDHHESERPFGDIRWVEPHMAATGLMIFHLLKNLAVEISDEIAVNLYSAIAVDTGNFKYDNTSPEAMNAAAELVKAGAKPGILYRHLFESWRLGRFRLFMAVMNTMEIADDIALITVTRKMFEETGTTPDDTEHFVEFPRIMSDIEVSVLFREIDDNSFKLSLRSKDDVNIAKVAEIYGGGGHKNAAGCRIKKDIVSAKAEIISHVKKAIAAK
jgi:phosphoesterase RecJ-like protein